MAIDPCRVGSRDRGRHVVQDVLRLSAHMRRAIWMMKNPLNAWPCPSARSAVVTHAQQHTRASSDRRLAIPGIGAPHLMKRVMNMPIIRGVWSWNLSKQVFRLRDILTLKPWKIAWDYRGCSGGLPVLHLPALTAECGSNLIS